MATAFQNENYGIGDVVMSTDYGTYEGQVVVLAGLLVGATISELDYNLRKGKSLKTYINSSLNKQIQKKKTINSAPRFMR